MPLVRDLYSTKMTHAEILSAAELSMQQIESSGIKNQAYLDEIKNYLTEDTGNYRLSLNRVLKSEYTDIIKEKDSTRDGYFVFIRTQAESYAVKPDPDLQAHGILIDQIIRSINYSMQDAGDAEQSVLTLRLFKAIDGDPAAVEALKTLGLTEDYEKLKQAQTDFDEVYKKRIDETDTKKEIPLLKDIRTRTVEDIKALINYLNIKTRSGDQIFTKIAVSIDEIIKNTEAKADARITRSENTVEE